MYRVGSQQHHHRRRRRRRVRFAKGEIKRELEFRSAAHTLTELLFETSVSRRANIVQQHSLDWF